MRERKGEGNIMGNRGKAKKGMKRRRSREETEKYIKERERKGKGKITGPTQ